MPITIGSNIASLQAQRQLAKASDRVSLSFERLSSGLRINHASDDAAGLSIATSLNASSRVATTALRNINDGMSALSIAQGGISELSKLVIRLKELAEQSANGVYSTAQRTALNAEAQSLTSEYARIVQTTSFNGVKLLNGAQSELSIQAGLNGAATSTLKLSLPSLSTAGIMTLVGDGTFAAAQTVNLSPNGSFIQFIDLNGDTHLDLAITSGSSLITQLGNGDGTFKASNTFVAGGSVQDVVFGYFDGDAYLDAFTTNPSGFSAGILLGNSDGSFRARTTFPITNANYLTSGDFNGDNRQDVIVSTSSGSTLFFGNGNGTFNYSQTLATPTLELSSADFDGDGDLDLVFAGSGVSVFLNNGNGTFTAPQTYSAGATRSVLVADLNGDGKMDLITPTDTGVATASILLGNGDGTFSAAKTLVNGTTGAQAQGKYAVANDFNGDGKLDLAFTNNSNSTISIFIGNGDGSFKASTTSAVSNAPFGIGAGDINENGTIDLVVAYSGGSTISILQGNGNTVPFSVDLSTQSSARNALGKIDSALDFLSLTTGKIGAFESRLHVAMGTVQTARENFSAAAARILDVDIAQESANLLRTQILQQTGAAILAQANQQPALAIQLLRA